MAQQRPVLHEPVHIALPRLSSGVQILAKLGALDKPSRLPTLWEMQRGPARLAKTARNGKAPIGRRQKMKLGVALTAMAMTLGIGTAGADQPSDKPLTKLDPAFDQLVAPDAKVEVVREG